MEAGGDIKLISSFLTSLNMRKYGDSRKNSEWLEESDPDDPPMQSEDGEGRTPHCLQNEGVLKGLSNKTECRQRGSQLHSAFNINMPINSGEILWVAINLLLRILPAYNGTFFDGGITGGTTTIGGSNSALVEAERLNHCSKIIVQLLVWMLFFINAYWLILSVAVLTVPSNTHKLHTDKTDQTILWQKRWKDRISILILLFHTIYLLTIIIYLGPNINTVQYYCHRATSPHLGYLEKRVSEHYKIQAYFQKKYVLEMKIFQIKSTSISQIITLNLGNNLVNSTHL